VKDYAVRLEHKRRFQSGLVEGNQKRNAYVHGERPTNTGGGGLVGDKQANGVES